MTRKKHSLKVGALGIAFTLAACGDTGTLKDAGSCGFDLLIDGALLVDGTGRPAAARDIAVNADRIAHIAVNIEPRCADKVIDGAGLVAAPGFIEPHAHISDIEAPFTVDLSTPDGASFDKSLAENYLRQGVTTIANTLHSLDQPAPLGAFLDRLKAAPNTVWTVGHTWIRKTVIGFDDRPPTERELARMIALVDEGMAAGAVGLGTGLEYIPAAYADQAEVVALAERSKRTNAVYVTHLRDEGAYLLEAIDEAIEIADLTDLPVHISHIKNTGKLNWAKTPDALARFDAALKRGTNASFDVYPYTAYSSYSSVVIPDWALAGGHDQYLQRVADPETRARILADMMPRYQAQTSGTLESLRFREVPGYVGKTLGDYLRAEGLPETLDAGMNAILDLHKNGRFLGVFEAMKDEDVLTFLKHPKASVSADGSLVAPGIGYPHPRSYGAFPRVLARYVRDQGALSLEEAIQKMTSVTAKALKLECRGTVAPGYYADLVLFDPDTISDKAAYTDPHHYSEGVRHLIINGQLVLEAGEVTGLKPGTVIRRSDADLSQGLCPTPLELSSGSAQAAE